jgi:hypothetical protein
MAAEVPSGAIIAILDCARVVIGLLFDKYITTILTRLHENH